jgi:hypothetical protein
MLLSKTIDFIDTSKRAAIAKQESLAETIYVNGVGLGSGEGVAVGGASVLVGVTVTVSVRVGVIVVSTIAPVCDRARYTMPAPTARKSTTKPIAAGRPKVISGILPPLTT